MAAHSSSLAARHQPADWIQVGLSRLASEGIDAVRVEVLARDLGVSKGSFYWHFRNREEFLLALLSHWEDQETEWLKSVNGEVQSAATRWAQLVERSADPTRFQLEAALRSWARKNPRVAACLTAIENARRSFVAGVLREVGFTPRDAEGWSELAFLVYLGWLDRATRDLEFQFSGRGLGEYLSELVLAASARLAGPHI